MNPLNQPTPSAPSGLTAALLLAAAGSLLAQAPAAATTYNESSAPAGDFGNSFAQRTTLTLGTTQVNGTLSLGGTSDPDFFSITGLLAGATYTVNTGAGAPGDNYAATFRGYNSSGAAIGTAATYTGADAANTPRSFTGTVPSDGILTIGISPQTGTGTDAEFGTADPYTAILSAPLVPEPATVTLVSLGAALAALAARRNRQPADAAE